jgi:hypothetical protein
VKNRQIRSYLPGLVCIAVLLTAVTYIGCAQDPSPSQGVTKENFGRIYFGMAVDEAGKILGAPCVLVQDAKPVQIGDEICKFERWQGDNCDSIEIWYTDRHGVYGKRWCERGEGIAYEEWEPIGIAERTARWIRNALLK